MYRPPCHRLDDREALFALIEAHPLGTWICHGPDGLLAHHRVFSLDRHTGPQGTLRARIERADSGALAVPPGSASLIVFHGPQAYITPGWYPGQAAHGRVVPTWNYAVVHAHGTLHRRADHPVIEVPIHRLEGRLKASQDEDRPDREGTVKGLNALDNDAGRTMAALVRRALDTPPT